jgi:hypothetical protein
MVSDTWWGVEDGKKKMHWRSWDWLTTPKSLGGMGFRDMALFNQAMLGKQAWRLLTEPESLCAKVLKGRYFPNSSFWSASYTRTSSYTWRSIIFGKELLTQGLRWGVGTGSSIRILEDNWIPNTPAYMVTPLEDLIILLVDGQTVDTLIDSESHTCN